jgi:hypothetical protein
VSSFLPIIIAGYISDLIGTTQVILLVAIATFVTGIASFILRGPLLETDAQADPHAVDPIAAALGADRPTWREPRPTIERPAVEPVALVGPSAIEPVALVGPSDPTDRD